MKTPTEEEILEAITEIDFDAMDGDGGVENYVLKISPEKLARFLAEHLKK